MKKYTFIFEFKKGTYISQFSAKTLEEAILDWAHLSEIPYCSQKEREKLINEIKKDEAPVAITELENVWCLFLCVGRKSHLLNIILTK